jgi:hypothetical protein
LQRNERIILVSWRIEFLIHGRVEHRVHGCLYHKFDGASKGTEHQGFLNENITMEGKVMSTTMTSPEDRHIAESLASGSVAEIIGGLAAIVLTILGLAHVAPTLMLPIATITIGVALVFEGGSIAAEYSRIISTTPENTMQSVEMGGGVAAEMVAGIAGIVLGMLALLGLDSLTLSASAVIVYGTALTLSSGMTSRFNNLRIEVSGVQHGAWRVTHDAVTAAAGTPVLVGLAAGVLGILALVGIAPTVMVLVALLTVGTSLLLSGGAVGGRLIRLFRHQTKSRLVTAAEVGTAPMGCWRMGVRLIGA